MAVIEFSLDGILADVQTNLELYIIDSLKYGLGVVNAFTNFVEILLKGFLVSLKLRALSSLSRRQREERLNYIKQMYSRKYMHELIPEITALQSFEDREKFITICDFLSTTKDEYRNEYTHEFFTYKVNIPLHVTRDMVINFLDFIDILAKNWSELQLKINARRKLRTLIYYCLFEKQNSEQRWRLFNGAIRKNAERFGTYLGNEFEEVKKLISLYELDIISEEEFCFKILGYDHQVINPLILIIRESDGLTENQIIARLRSQGFTLQLRELSRVLDDLCNQGKIQKRYENGRIVYLSIEYE